ncbi:MAG: hypothetical protein PHD61_08325 [Bacteroidales bacterium]|nr:hypothetical protein [Lentimicrobiaceae bacterium]MDD5695296.1 hypothetical protein [Bacteroidales bacterium]
MKSMNSIGRSIEILSFNQLRNILGGDGEIVVTDEQDIDMPDINTGK